MSISTHVSRVTRRCRRGTIDWISAIALSRSKIQYAPTAKTKTMPTSTSNAVFVALIAGWRRLVPDGSCRSRLSIALRIAWRRPCEWVAAWWSCFVVVGTVPIALCTCVIATGTTR